MSGALHLIASIGGTGVLLDASQVESVVDVGEIVLAPCTPACVRGLAALRSRVVTVLDTWHILGLPPQIEASGRAVVTAIEGQSYAILVDALEDTVTTTPNPVPAGLPLGPRWRAAVSGAATRDGETLLALDLTRLVAMAAN